MQPAIAQPQADIKNLMDWLFTQFKATDPITVKNITSQPYHFKYCTGEEINTPDQFTKVVLDRTYDERDIAPGEELNLLGGAAYVFVDGVARAYLYESTLEQTEGDEKEKQRAAGNALGAVVKLIEAAEKVIVGKASIVGAKTPARAQETAKSAPEGQNTLLDAPQTSTGPKYSKHTLSDGEVRYTKDGKTISKAEYDAGSAGNS